MITPEETQAVREFAAFVSLFGEIAEAAALDGWIVVEVPAGTWEWVAIKPIDDSGRFAGIKSTVILSEWRWKTPNDRLVCLIIGRSHLTRTVYWWSEMEGQSVVSRLRMNFRSSPYFEKGGRS